MSTIAEPFKALGAGNGFTFCREKASAVFASESDKPTSIKTLKESMAWYWLLKDFNITITMVNTGTGYEDPVFTGDLSVAYSDFFGANNVITGEPNPLAFMSKPPKDRAVLTDAARASGFSDSQLDAFAYGNNGQNGFTTTGNLNAQQNHYEVDFIITWYDDDSCTVLLVISGSYNRFVLTNLPTTSSDFANGETVDQITSLGTVSTDYGVLTGYDLSPRVPNTSLGGGGNAYSVTSFSFTSSFYTFE
jgi:hypothetical protein